MINKGWLKPIGSFGKDKRGQELSTNTIILIILGITILVILIVGFMIGWNKILPFLNPANVDDIKNACNIACTTNSQYGFCSSGRDLKSDNEDLKEVTCNFLAQKKTIYGIEPCVSVSCDNIVFVELAAGEKIEDKCTGNEGKIIQGLSGNTFMTKECSAKEEIASPTAPTVYDNLIAAKAACTTAGEKVSYKELEVTKEYTCAAGDGAIPAA